MYRKRVLERGAPGAHPPTGLYQGGWTPGKLREELAKALKSKFSTNDVDTSGSTAIRVHSNTARVDADVVPCFTFKKYYAKGAIREGTKIFRRTSGSIVNYPCQQLENGRAKNLSTGYAYKKTVRILKRVNNLMIQRGGLVHPLPSYFIECLAYNCTNAQFDGETWTDIIREALSCIWTSLQGDEPQATESRWVEVNEYFYLFHKNQGWTRDDGRTLRKQLGTT